MSLAEIPRPRKRIDSHITAIGEGEEIVYRNGAEVILLVVTGDIERRGIWDYKTRT
jgi:hypothetical protein